MNGGVSILHRIRRFVGKRHSPSAVLGAALLLTFSLQFCDDASAMAVSDDHPGEQTILAGDSHGRLPQHGGDHVTPGICCFAGTMEHQGAVNPDNTVPNGESRPLFQGQATIAALPDLNARPYRSTPPLWRLEPRQPIPPVYLATLRLRF